MQTALYYLLYVKPEFQTQLSNRELIEEYFEKFYFARKKFLVNFLSRKQGNRWNGRFRRLLNRHRKDQIVHAFQTAGAPLPQQEPQLGQSEPGSEGHPQSNSKSQTRNQGQASAARLIEQPSEVCEYVSEAEKKQEREQSLRREIDAEMEKLFDPLSRGFKVG